MIFDYLRADLAGDKHTHHHSNHKERQAHAQHHDADHHDNHDRPAYPNSKDEIFLLEQYLGKIRCCFNFVDSPEHLEVEQVLVPKPEKPVVRLRLI